MVSSCAPWWVPRSDFIGGRAAVRWSPTSVTWSCKDVPHRTAHTPDPSRGGEDKYRYRDELGRRVVDIRRPAIGRNDEKATAHQHNDGDRVGDPTEHLPEAARHRRRRGCCYCLRLSDGGGGGLSVAGAEGCYLLKGGERLFVLCGLEPLEHCHYSPLCFLRVFACRGRCIEQDRMS